MPLGINSYLLKTSLFVWLCKEGNKNLLANNEVPVLSFFAGRFFIGINGVVFHYMTEHTLLLHSTFSILSLRQIRFSCGCFCSGRYSICSFIGKM